MEKPAYHALDRNILAVATTLPSGEWGAYIGIVEGKNHDEELKGVLQTGTKLREPIARALFPLLLKTPYGF